MIFSINQIIKCIDPLIKINNNEKKRKQLDTISLTLYKRLIYHSENEKDYTYIETKMIFLANKKVLIKKNGLCVCLVLPYVTCIFLLLTQRKYRK